MNTPYPFSALVGQEDLKLSLLLNAVSPEVGGVLVRGEKGTAKSTAVRALASLLPPIQVVAGCPYSCDPDEPNPECPAGPHPADAPRETRPVRLVELPVGASADRLAGTLDLERALVQGEKAFEPGLLAAAHRGILYVDEVNLLSDHLVDLLLDVAAMGVNHVEREGVSVKHPARFILVGTMNPEEGELRPQLLDRFGLSVESSGSLEASQRVEVVRRRLHYEADPAEFAAKFSAADRELAAAVDEARGKLSATHLPDDVLYKVSNLCAELGVDGMRGDLVTAKAARSLAAWEGRASVELDDVRRAAPLALAHRRRRNPFEQPGVDSEEIENALSDPEDPEPPDDPRDDGPGGASDTGDATEEGEGGEGGEVGEAGESGGGGSGKPSPEAPGKGQQSHASSDSFRPERLEVPEKGRGGPLGRRSRSVSDEGQPVGDREPRDEVRDIAVGATLRAAAPHQRERGRSEPGLAVRSEDLREKVREGREGNLILFVVDASGSMAARSRMSAVKGAALSLLTDAYQRRDRISLISFRGDAAETLLPPTSSVDLAAPRLEELPTGGRTPLAAGLERASEIILRERLRDKERRPLVVLLTDGRSTSGPDPALSADRLRKAGVASVVVDTESGNVRLGMAQGVARHLGARCLRLEELRSESLVEVVDGRRVA
jgi:magnesium chelatase subunit D